MTNLIISKDTEKEHDEKNIEVEHMYINFEMLIIAEKLRAFEKGTSTSKLLFNHFYYSTLMTDQD